MLDISVTGLDEIQRRLETIQHGLASLDGEIAHISFNPNDPQSVDRAIQEMEAAVDAKASHTDDPLVKNVVSQMKKAYREGIVNAKPVET